MGIADGDRRTDAMLQTYRIQGDKTVTVPATNPILAGGNNSPVKGITMAERPQPWRLPMKANAGPKPYRLQPF